MHNKYIAMQCCTRVGPESAFLLDSMNTGMGMVVVVAMLMMQLTVDNLDNEEEKMTLVV